MKTLRDPVVTRDDAMMMPMVAALRAQVWGLSVGRVPTCHRASRKPKIAGIGPTSVAKTPS